MRTKTIKLFGVELSFHPLFVIFALFLMYYNCFLFINYIIVMFIHEYMHAYVAYRCGYKIGNIKLMPFGICLNLKNNKMMPSDEVKIALAGPMINFILYFVCLALFWMLPISFALLYNFAFCNLVIGIFNLLPVMPLDGGRVLVGTLSNFLSRNNVIKICYGVNCIVAFAFVFLFFLILPVVNFTILFFGLFILIGGIPPKRKNLTYNFLQFSTNKKNNYINKTKTIVVEEYTPIYKLFTYVSSNYYLVIYVKDQFNKIKLIVDEYTLEKICNKYPPTKSIGEVLI